MSRDKDAKEPFRTIHFDPARLLELAQHWLAQPHLRHAYGPCGNERFSDMETALGDDVPVSAHACALVLASLAGPRGLAVVHQWAQRTRKDVDDAVAKRLVRFWRSCTTRHGHLGPPPMCSPTSQRRW